MVQDLPEEHPLAEAALPLACTTQMHRDTGQTSPGLLPLDEGSPSAETSHAPTGATTSIWSGSLDQRLVSTRHLGCQQGADTDTQSKIVIWVREIPKGPSTVTGFRPGTVQTQGKRHIACECVLARSSWVGEPRSRLCCTTHQGWKKIITYYFSLLVSDFL